METKYTMEMGVNLTDLEAKVKTKEVQGWKCEGDVCIYISKVDTENFYQILVKNNLK